MSESRPPVVCLCGSTRFYQEFQHANYELTMAGWIVLTVGFYPRSPQVHGEGVGLPADPVQAAAVKEALDELHKRKIDLADSVLVINPGGYVGESTRSEIEYALAHGKPVGYWNPAAMESLGPHGVLDVLTEADEEPARTAPLGGAPFTSAEVNQLLHGVWGGV